MLWERYRVVVNLDLPLVPLDLRVQIDDTAGGRDDTTLRNKNCLDECRDATGSFTVANICLDGADQQRLFPWLAILVHGHRNGVHFKRVTDSRTGTMALEVTGQPRVEVATTLVGMGDNVGLVNGALDDLLLFWVQVFGKVFVKGGLFLLES